MDNKQEILQKLKETDGYLSGQELCRSLGVSRTAVWKAVNRLKEEGYQIEAVTHKGYRLIRKSSTDIFNQKELEEAFHTSFAGRPLIWKKETGSSNEDVFRLSDRGYPEGTLVVTSCQRAGRGRRGRTWISPPDVNVYMSILLKPRIPAGTAPMVTLIMALAVYEAALELSQDPEGSCSFGIKWPNDIVASRQGGPWKKVCGILTEMRMEEMEIKDIVIGTGLNVNQKDFPEEIADTASSFALETGMEIGRAAFTASVWKHFEEEYSKFIKAGSLAPLKSLYEKGLVNRGRFVKVLDPQDPFTGTARGITDTGDLIVIPEDGGPDRIVSSGEVSVRGVNGYV